MMRSLRAGILRIIERMGMDDDKSVVQQMKVQSIEKTKMYACDQDQQKKGYNGCHSF
jgi:hypothetical protein